MHRTQLYIDEPLMQTLLALGRKKKLSVSELVRQALEKVYGNSKHKTACEKAFSASHGIWKDHDDVRDPAVYIRGLRSGKRLERLK